MNSLQNLKLSIVAAGFMLMPNIALADFKSEIIESCTAYQQGKDKSHINACKLYIDGYIDSSLFTEVGVVKPQAMIDKQPTQQSNYMKRVYQTRVLTTSSMIVNEDAHQFCIPREYDRKSIASAVAKSIDISELARKPLKEVLFETLIADFPCRS